MNSDDIFFTADHHFGHGNIIKLANRPFGSLEEMNESLVKHHNATVPEDSVVYFIGDFAYRVDTDPSLWFHRLNGRKKIFIPGNHDNEAVMNLPWDEIHRDMFIGHAFTPQNRVSLHLYHYPLIEWRDFYKGAYHLHGHTHNTINVSWGRNMDVGVDAQEFCPVSLTRVVERLKVYDNKATRKFRFGHLADGRPDR